MAELPQVYEKTMMAEDAEHVYPDIIALRCNFKIYPNGDTVLALTDKEQEDFNVKKVEIFLTKNKMSFLKNFLNEITELK